MRLINNIGFILLAIYLIMVSLIAILGIIVPGLLIGLVALAAAIFILIGR